MKSIIDEQLDDLLTTVSDKNHVGVLPVWDNAINVELSEDAAVACLICSGIEGMRMSFAASTGAYHTTFWYHPECVIGELDKLEWVDPGSPLVEDVQRIIEKRKGMGGNG